MVYNGQLHARAALLLAVVLSLACQFDVAHGAQRAAPGGAPPAGSGSLTLGGYIRVIQGDTLDARSIRGRVGIGIVGIRAPRGNTACGRAATAFVQDLVEDGAQLEEEPGLAFDARFRRMYHVTTPDGRSVAEELVAAGLARATGQGRKRDRLAELEADARGARRGCLWNAGGAP